MEILEKVFFETAWDVVGLSGIFRVSVGPMGERQKQMDIGCRTKLEKVHGY